MLVAVVLVSFIRETAIGCTIPAAMSLNTVVKEHEPGRRS